MTDYSIRKEIAGGGNTIYEADLLINEGNTDFECINTNNSSTKFEATLKTARELGLEGNYSTRYEADKAIYDSIYDKPIPFFNLNENISTDSEFNALPWGKKIEYIQLLRDIGKNKWSLISLPYTCKRSDISLSQNDVSFCKVLSIRGNVDRGSGTFTSQLVNDNDTIQANYPYAVYNRSNLIIPSIQAYNVRFTSNRQKSNIVKIDDNWSFVANMFKTNYSGNYAISNGDTVEWLPSNTEVLAYKGLFLNTNL